jgi:DNA-binding response OmpR family regulator
MPKILIIEDEHKICDFIKKILEFEKYTVETAYDGSDGLKKARINRYDVVILDILLPGMDGLDICKKLRDFDNDVPIIMLTAKDTVEDRIKGLNVGADDYMVKPFEFEELLARIRSLRRRDRELKQVKFKLGDLVLDTVNREVTRGGKRISLSGREYKLLDYMMRRPGKVCTRTMIGEHVWGYEFDPRKSNVIDIYLHRLRKKIDSDCRVKLIHTIKESGYKIIDPGSKIKK